MSDQLTDDVIMAMCKEAGFNAPQDGLWILARLAFEFGKDLPGPYLQIDDLCVGPNMVNNYREQIARLTRERDHYFVRLRRVVGKAAEFGFVPRDQYEEVKERADDLQEEVNRLGSISEQIDNLGESDKKELVDFKAYLGVAKELPEVIESKESLESIVAELPRMTKQEIIPFLERCTRGAQHCHECPALGCCDNTIGQRIKVFEK